MPTSAGALKLRADVRDLLVLHAVVRHGSLAAAAEELRLNASGVSRLMTRLETRLGVRLFERTTRRLTLTPAGAAFHERTGRLLADLGSAELEVRQAAREPSGNLRLGAPVPFGQTYLAPLLGSLVERFPGLSVELILQDGINDLVEEGIDLVVRIGLLKYSRLVSRRLCTNRRILVASPAYLRERGTPTQPSELSAHVCLPCTYMVHPNEWELLGPNGAARVAIGGGVSSNNIGVLVAAAEAGQGISVGPTQSVAPALRAGRLVQVLPGWEFERTAIYALYPSRRQLSAKVRATVDFLSEHFTDPPPWDEGLPLPNCSPLAEP
jgi:DNA-binding transcriptional LysR family regulator